MSIVTSPSSKKLPRGRNQGLYGCRNETIIPSSFIARLMQGEGEILSVALWSGVFVWIKRRSLKRELDPTSNTF